VKDAFIVRSLQTIRKIRKDYDWLLLHPHPIRIPRRDEVCEVLGEDYSFWEYWKKHARKKENKHKRLEIVKKFELAKDTKIHIIERLLLDIDQPYESCDLTVKNILSKFSIKSYSLGTTKSGNMRVIIPINAIDPGKRRATERLTMRISKSFWLFFIQS
ncbi:MAG: hypothetical protein ABDI07_11550, partial [Candidatus Kryptonium sp.]